MKPQPAKTQPLASFADLAGPQALAASQDLDLVARGVVEGFLHGLHRSPYVGFSTDFSSHREYIPGDDLRHLNWKIYGRHDRLCIKQYDAETNVDLHLVLDVSGSMTVESEGASKLKYGALLCAALAHLALRQRDAVGLTLCADQVVEHHPARGTSDHLLSLMAALAKPREFPPAAVPQSLHEAAELMPRRGLAVYISDLFYEPDEVFAGLDHLRHFGHDVVVFQILDPLERRLPAEGPIKLLDAESGETLETIGHEIRAGYISAVDDWLRDLRTGCQSRGLDHHVCVTDEPFARSLAAYCMNRSRLL